MYQGQIHLSVVEALALPAGVLGTFLGGQSNHQACPEPCMIKFRSQCTDQGGPCTPECPLRGWGVRGVPRKEKDGTPVKWNFSLRSGTSQGPQHLNSVQTDHSQTTTHDTPSGRHPSSSVALTAKQPAFPCLALRRPLPSAAPQWRAYGHRPPSQNAWLLSLAPPLLPHDSSSASELPSSSSPIMFR